MTVANRHWAFNWLFADIYIRIFICIITQHRRCLLFELGASHELRVWFYVWNITVNRVGFRYVGSRDVRGNGNSWDPMGPMGFSWEWEWQYIMVTSVGWQITLCDPIWQVASRSSEVNFTKNYMLLYLFYGNGSGNESMGMWIELWEWEWISIPAFQRIIGDSVQ